MSDLWKRWEGQVIDHKYQLRQFLGSTDHSTVFCAEFRAPELRNAAVKFLAADLPHSEQVLAGWKQAQELSHPHLLAIYSVGRCRIEDMDLIYVASEYADENLSEILPQRALTNDEAREMLSMVVEALVYLHVKKLTHGHVKPSNIMAIGDQLKLTSDTIEPFSEARQMRRKRDVYDAPEIPAEAYTPASDVWSLGVTLVEALTQQPAFLPFNENADPVIPPALREPFRDIASNALRRDPNARWESLDIAAKLNPEAAGKLRTAIAAANAANPQAAVLSTAAASSTGKTSLPAVGATTNDSAIAVASAAGATAASPAPPVVPKPPQPVVSPLSVPLSKEPAVPLAKQASTPSPKPSVPPVALPSIPETRSASRKTVLLPNYFVPVLAAVLIVAALVALPKMLRRQTQISANSPSSPAPVVRQAPAASSADNSSAAAPNEPSKTESSAATKSNNPPASSQFASRTAPAASTPAPAIVRNSNPPPIATTRRASGSPDRGEVLDQIIPRPSSDALASIDGTVRVIVRVRVDPAGNVSQALLEKAGPSKYFAQKSLEAARGWVFLSPANNGRSQESEWLIRFDFTHAGANAYPQQVSP
jgi:eukaryotic-like serine/threonine-protein kinase